MFLNIHRLFLMAIPDKVSLILSILKLLFAEPVLLRLLILILFLWNFVSSLKSPSSFSSPQSFKQFVYKTMITTVVNTVRWKQRILQMDFSNDLFLSQVKVTVRITPGGTVDFK